MKILSLLSKYKYNIFPFLLWLPELKNKETLKIDIISWITVALVLVPQSMAYAQLAWLEVYYWLYASFLPVIIASLWWSSRQLATWPVAVVSLLTASTLEGLAISWPIQFALYAAIIAFVVWLIQFFMWVFKLWKLVDFLSHPVIIGFINAVAIIIWASQLNKIFWLQFGQILSTWWILEKSPNNYEQILDVLRASITDTHTLSLLFWVWSILIILYIKTYFKKLPWVLIVVVIFTLLSFYLEFQKLWWKIVWDIPSWLPDFSFPLSQFSFKDIKDILWQILVPAITIAIIWFAEAISIAKSMASQSKQSISPNKELIGQWLWNIVSSLNHWYAVSWSFSRSAVNFSSWAKTGFSWVVTWIVVVITLLFLTPLLYYLPQATLAAIIIVAVGWLFKIKLIIHAWQIQKHDWLIAIVVFIYTLISAPHLEKWLIIWVSLSIFFFIYRTMTPRFVEFSYSKWTLKDSDLLNLKNSKDIWMYWFKGSLYFVNAWFFEWKLLKFIANKKDLKLLIIDFEWITEIDSSWLEVIENIVYWIQKKWIIVLFSRVKRPVLKAFDRSWYLKHFWEENIFINSRYDALNYAKNTLKLNLDYKPFFKEIQDEEKIKVKWLDYEVWLKWKIRRLKKLINKIRQKDLS